MSHQLLQTIRGGRGKPLGFIAIHRGSKKYPAFGATRIHAYRSVADARKDALRLSKLMSYKAAMANLKHGGGKGVLILSEDDQKNSVKKRTLLQRYAKEVNLLDGLFITGADVGVSPADVRFLRKHSRHVVGISRDPVHATALGVMHSIRATVKQHYGKSTLEGRVCGILGVGKIGAALVAQLVKEGAHILIADIKSDRAAKLKKTYPQIAVLSPRKLLRTHMEIFIPCAMGGILNKENVKRLRTELIVGAANNQLENDAVGDQLHQRGIFYAPDYIVNGGGLMSVVNEHHNEHTKPLYHQIKRIGNSIEMIYKQSKATNKAPHRLANMIARKKIISQFPKKR